jgi:hypothetical protein
MILSSFDWNKLKYDYFETNKFSQDIGGWNELQGLGIQNKSNSNGLGVDIEDALPDLPSDAVFVGSGDQAIGRVVKPKHKRRNFKNPINGLSGFGYSLGDNSGAESSIDITERLAEDVLNHSNGQPIEDSQPNEQIESNSEIQYNKIEAGHVPLSTFIVPLFSGMTIGYYTALKTKDSGIDHMKVFIALLGSIAVGVKIGKDHSLFSTERKEVKNGKN